MAEDTRDIRVDAQLSGGQQADESHDQETPAVPATRLLANPRRIRRN
jgi:hypothetical protein